MRAQTLLLAPATELERVAMARVAECYLMVLSLMVMRSAMTKGAAMRNLRVPQEEEEEEEEAACLAWVDATRAPRSPRPPSVCTKTTVKGRIVQ